MKSTIHAIIFLLSITAAYLTGQKIERLERELFFQKAMARDRDNVLWSNGEKLYLRVKHLEWTMYSDRRSVLNRLQELEREHQHQLEQHKENNDTESTSQTAVPKVQ